MLKPVLYSVAAQFPVDGGPPDAQRLRRPAAHDAEKLLGAALRRILGRD
jgi:hypothetical protein